MHESYETRFGRGPDFRVKYRFLSADEGGRKSRPPFQGIRCDFAYEDFGKGDDNVYMIWPEFEDEQGRVIIENDMPVTETGTARLWILSDDLRKFHKTKIKVGLRAFMMEGAHRTAEYEVIEVVDLQNV